MIEELPIASPRPELKIAVTAALDAGKAVMEVYATKFTSQTKDDNSQITEADIKSNRIIKEILGKTDHWILSEEDRDNKGRLEQKHIWIVDPLDGTLDFIEHTGEFTIMIALVEMSVPVIGVIFWPAENVLFVAQKNSGAFRYADGKWMRIHVTDVDELKDCRMVTSRNHLSETEKTIFEKLGVKKITGVGSSLKVAKISSGEAEMYITTTDKIKEWDSCASCCIVTEAGGRMTDNLGNDLTYNNRIVNHQNGIIASNGAVHEQIIQNMKRLG